ncbi:MAG: hypothetical protein ABSF25_03785 [Bryobacteraceae bacterium]|jgi:hypothetical protein
MEPAHLGVILDSSFVIEAERQRLDVARLLKYVAARIGERETALCSTRIPRILPSDVGQALSPVKPSEARAV